MIQKKVCMLGTFAVGKTSLVRRFVESIYSDKYHTTIGVKIDKKLVQLENSELMLILWDIEGTETEFELRKSYLRGAAGYLLVADGTRQDTLYKALALQTRVEEIVGSLPFLLLMNKADLADQWNISERETTALNEKGWEVIQTSAKTGLGVEEAFHALAKKLAEA
ncbi:MAG TPA: Rab family GTPase [Pyrinomonadaceae bacterium]|nr:Rab family GTPase [Pyrinomonadaceae bacterium]